MRHFRGSVIVAILFAAPTRAAETVDNPEFTSWSSFPKGTRLTTKSTSTSSFRGRTDTTTTVRELELLEAGKEKITFEETVTFTDIVGQESKKTEKYELHKLTLLPYGMTVEQYTKWGYALLDQRGDPKTAEETIKVTGGEYKTKAYRLAKINDFERIHIEASVWMSDDIPGRVVKRITIDNCFETATRTELEVIKFKKP